MPLGVNFRVVPKRKGNRLDDNIVDTDLDALLVRVELLAELEEFAHLYWHLDVIVRDCCLWLGKAVGYCFTHTAQGDLLVWVL